MGKYLHLYENQGQLNKDYAWNSPNYLEPWVSLTKDGNIVNYNLIDSNPTNGYDYVDMGFPTGTIWSTCNLGASAPEQIGSWYSWGTASSSSNWNSYPFYENGSITKYTKADGKVELELEDDPSNIILGGKWRTPTIEQFEELMQYSTMTTGHINNVYCYTFTSKINGNSIIIPNVDSLYPTSYMYWLLSLADYGDEYADSYGNYYHNDRSSALRYGGHQYRPVIRMNTPTFGGLEICTLSTKSQHNPARRSNFEMSDPLVNTYQTCYGKHPDNRSTYFSFVEAGNRFSSQEDNFDASSGAIDNTRNWGGWRIPTRAEWNRIYGYEGNRPGSNVNGIPNVLKVWIRINDQEGLLLFPDNYYIEGKELNLTSTNELTQEEYYNYLNQGCVFIGAFGSCFLNNGETWTGYNSSAEILLADQGPASFQCYAGMASSSLSNNEPITLLPSKTDYYTQIRLVR